MPTIRIVAIAATLFAAVASQAATDTSYDLYRRTVLGDSSVTTPVVTSSRTSPHLVPVPGPYARHLIANGEPSSKAIAAARRVGEITEYRWVREEGTYQPLNAVAAHEKFLGNSDYAVRFGTESAE